MPLPLSLHLLAAALCAAATLFTAMPVQAGEGHDHGEAPATAAGPALPRFSAVSETFELVGVLDGRRLTLYLDRYADNSPVKGARLDLEIAGAPVTAEPHADGEFEATLPAVPEASVLPVTATVVAGDETDLLAGELDIHDDHAAEPSAASPALPGWAGWAAGAAVVAAAAAWMARRAASRRAVVASAGAVGGAA